MEVTGVNYGEFIVTVREKEKVQLLSYLIDWLKMNGSCKFNENIVLKYKEGEVQWYVGKYVGMGTVFEFNNGSCMVRFSGVYQDKEKVEKFLPEIVDRLVDVALEVLVNEC